MSFKANWKNGSIELSGTWLALANATGFAWRRLRDYFGFGDATYFLPRWIFLRLVGVVYVLIFVGILREGQGLMGPGGIAPVDQYLASVVAEGDFFHRLATAPSLFWFASGAKAISSLAWLGMAAALALLLNLWPRLALFTCWLAFLSFVTTWRDFTPAQLDGLMLEVALLSVFFAPKGVRPGLGIHSPPHPLAVLVMRFLVFRVIFESGLVKLMVGDPHWRDFTAMDVMYETTPFPTVLSYMAHHLPHWFHVIETLFTFVAELAVPLLCLTGRRGRVAGLFIWTAFQAGIQLTNNFGWLNFSAAALGLLLLDDQLLKRASEFLKIPVSVARSPRARPRWQSIALGTLLSLHLYLAVLYLFKSAGLKLDSLPEAIVWPAKNIFKFRSTNEYHLYAKVATMRQHIEFEGSADNGSTWRAYEYRYQPQKLDRMSPFIAPYFGRFEATLQVLSGLEERTTMISAIGELLMKGSPEVVGLFANNPFPDRPPNMIRFPAYQFSFLDLPTHKKTGAYWKRVYIGEYAPIIRKSLSN